MTISPQDSQVEKPERTRYDWSSIVLGEWQNWLDLRDGPEVTNEEAIKAATRVRAAAIDYGNRHGLKVQSRRLDFGRVLDLRFTPKNTEAAS